MVLSNEDNTEIKDENELKNQKVEENTSSEETKEEVKEDILEELKNENKKLQDENDKLNNQQEVLKDRLERTMAEYDNYRKRTAKEKEGIYDDACEDVLKTMLPVLDNLERAIIADGSIDDLKKGIEMTIKQFEESFKTLAVEEVDTENGFDPNFHNAVMHVEDEQYKEKEIVEVFQKGYKKGNKVLRYSMVKVAN